jgi:CubicO group peptidase (beta-lactamase class C family)
MSIVDRSLPGICMTFRTLIPLALASIILTSTSSAQAADQVDSLMHDYTGQVPGASLLVVRNGRPILERAYGLSDLEKGIRADPSTNYRLASVTKQFTAAAILLLAQDRKLSLNDPVRRWLPSLPAALDSVTLTHLLTHTSGIIDYEDVMAPDTKVQVHDSDVLSLLESQDSTYFKPGTKYRYSNSGYSLLALIVQRVSGKKFAAFLHDRIFQPLGMEHTVAFEDGISTVSNRAYGYANKDQKWTRRDQSLTSAVLGDGGIYSSINDLAKWDAALYDARLLSDESRRLAFSPHVATGEPNESYGFGWYITGETLWHSGETSGFRNVIVRYPARHMSVIILTNRNDPVPYETALQIAGLFIQDR